MDTFIPQILKHDLFLLLKTRFQLAQGDTDTIDSIVITRNGIEFIERYDGLISSSENQERMTKGWYQRLNVHDQDEKRAEVLKFYVDNNSIKPWDGLDIPVFRKITELTTCMNSIDDLLDKNNNVIHNFQRTLQQAGLGSYPIDREQQEQFCLSLIELYSSIAPKLADDETIKEWFVLTDDEEHYFQQFNNLIEKHKQVYVICLNIELTVCDASIEKSYEAIYLNLKNKITYIRDYFSEIQNLIGYFIRLEPMQKYGLNVHCILIFDHEIKEESFCSNLDKVLQKSGLFHQKEYAIRNWSKILSKYYQPKAVGLIKKNNQVAREECWYWVFSYFFNVDQVIGLQIGTKNCLVHLRNDIQLSDWTTLTIKNNDSNINQSITWAELAKSVDKKRVLAVNHLPSISQQYLEIMQDIYFDSGDANIRYFYLIELFCENLKFSTTLLFNDNLSKANKKISVKDYHKRLSRLGLIWLYLLRELESISSDRVALHAWSTQLKSRNFKAFYELIESDLSQLHGLSKKIIDIAGIEETEQYLEKLKTQLIQFDYTKKIKDLDKKYQHFSIYVKHLLENDIIIARVHISFFASEKELSKKAQAIVLTEFLRVGRSAKPLNALRGYIIRWKERGPVFCESKDHLGADLTLFFDNLSTNKVSNIFTAIENYLKSFLEKYNNKIPSSDVITYKFKENLISEFLPELYHTHLLIESTDTHKYDLLLGHYLKSICYFELFSPLDSDSKKEKWLTKGVLKKVTD